MVPQISDFLLALRELADESNPVARRVLAKLSGSCRTEVEAFAACWHGLSVERRREVAKQLAALAEERFDLDYASLFRELLRDENAAVRRYGVEGLWEDEGADLVPSLLKLLAGDPAVEVRAAAATSLGRFVYMAECEELNARRAATVREALEHVAASPQEDIEVVRRAVESLAYINDDRVQRIIDRAYDHHDERMRESAVFAMGRSADVFWADTVLIELDAPISRMRCEAARASGELQIRRAVEPLIKLVNDPEHEVQTMAIWALGQIGGKRARITLEHLTEGDDEALATAAVEAIDELELNMRSMELLVHELGPDNDASAELAVEDEEDEFSVEEDDLDSEEEWADEFVDLD